MKEPHKTRIIETHSHISPSTSPSPSPSAWPSRVHGIVAHLHPQKLHTKCKKKRTNKIKQTYKYTHTHTQTYTSSSSSSPASLDSLNNNFPFLLLLLDKTTSFYIEFGLFHQHQAPFCIWHDLNGENLQIGPTFQAPFFLFNWKKLT